LKQLAQIDTLINSNYAIECLRNAPEVPDKKAEKISLEGGVTWLA